MWAALIETGIVAEHSKESLPDILDRIGGGLEIITEVRGIPQGSGLGVSSILGGAIIAGLLRMTGQSFSNDRLVAHVLNLEQRIGVLGGWQDPVGGIVGGLKDITADVGNPIPQPKLLLMDKAKLSELKERMVLLYVGSGHASTSIVRNVIGDYLLRKHDQFRARLESKRILGEFFEAFRSGDIDRVGRLFSGSWDAFKRVIGPEATSDWIEKTLADVSNLTDGGKVSGS